MVRGALSETGGWSGMETLVGAVVSDHGGAVGHVGKGIGGGVRVDAASRVVVPGS